MKKIYLSIIVLLVAISSQAQVPQAFSYQAVVRNSSNALVANQTVSERISLLKDSIAGTVVYSESQSVKTNANGLVSLQIGTGSVLSGSFKSINWATGTYFIKIETDPTGGSNYTLSNTSQLLSVPYALQAGSAPSLDYPDGFANATSILLSNGNSYTVPSGKNFYLQEGQGSGYGSQGFTIGKDTFHIQYAQNLVIGSNETIKLLDTSIFISGFIVDKGVTALTIDLNKANYTVPTGKTFVLLAISNVMFMTSNIRINGINPNPNGDSGWPEHILLLSAGTVLSGQSIINGYLK